MKKKILFSGIMAAFAFTSVSQADVVVGVNVSATGPAAAIGIQSQNAMSLWPETLGGEKAKYIILDDGTDVSKAVRNVRKLTSEDKVDIIIGPNTTAATLALLDVLKETQTPLIALAASSSIVEPADDPGRRWVFKMPQNDGLMADVLIDEMVKKGHKTIGFIGFADSYGENWWKEFTSRLDGRLEVVARESFQRTDSSVVGQALKLISAKPDAILVAGAGTPAVLPEKTLKDRGYKNPIYQTHGIGTLEFLQVGGKSVEGTLFPTGPGVVARGLPDSNPVKAVAMDFTERYEDKYGPNTATQFAGDAWGAWIVADKAVSRVIKKGIKPGTVEFRNALRDEIENTKDLIVPNGVLNITPADHQGFDARAAVMGTIKDGKFVYAGEQ
ncbi:ABC transporter substrate-binding protein [Advenella alkanexedens]|jgi:branched-chain amino acid transport system substrate-binding protein|uniref:ABC transporter substrate-binding protein n=1 Tax=Advenella alkanexedens TaxID=1481665 RepID=A0ABS6NPP1_9BURK|nr:MULTISPECIES: ABC transporter substrate-binding protein [Advenella]MBV4397603.1 ABC transporter substrate-binding protein [Advenella alkanexedens]MDD3758809.1 ABC transporter substrate-binding protein [Advenella sp.]NLN69020.1 ABC transporter substrate-binding protein [Alcaligenaceae bacterium]